jgi:hypothetical protein
VNADQGIQNASVVDYFFSPKALQTEKKGKMGEKHSFRLEKKPASLKSRECQGRDTLQRADSKSHWAQIRKAAVQYTYYYFTGSLNKETVPRIGPEWILLHRPMTGEGQTVTATGLYLRGKVMTLTRVDG